MRRDRATTVTAGSQLAVEISLRNDAPVLIVQVPIEFAATGCVVDSLAFSAHFKPHLPQPLSWHDADPEPLRVDIINTRLTAVAAGERLFATSTGGIIEPSFSGGEIRIVRP